ncbi:MAG: tripartite tricarboxylate transporter substrate binding protein [Pseudomonadota bacterium]
MVSLKRKFLHPAQCLMGLLLASSIPHAALAQTQNFPNKAIHIIAPIPAGGSTDRLVRLVAQHLQKRVGQSVVVENKPGGSSSIGTAFVAKSAPDGYTLVLVNGSHAINPHVYPSLPFDAIKDFTPVVHMTSLSMGLFVNPSLPVNNLAEFIALAKAKPETINYASAGNGGVGHLTGEMFKHATGLTTQHIPYRGSAPALVDTISGQVQAVFTDAPLVQQHVKAGKLRALALASKGRSVVLPNVPTFTESGVRNMENSIWVGLLAPANTPADIVRTLNREIVAILRDPAMTADLNGQGFDVVASTPEEFAKSIRDDYATFGAIVKSARIKAD